MNVPRATKPVGRKRGPKPERVAIPPDKLAAVLHRALTTPPPKPAPKPKR